jgi:hypothetical protein
LKCSTRRRSWASTRSPNSTPNVALGTVKKSIATRSFTWLSKNARQDGDDGFLCFTMYLATVDTATSMPSFASSLRMRGAPQVTFAVDIFRIRPTSSRSKPGRPPRPARLLRVQKRLNPSRCHRTTVAGCTIARAYRQASHRRANTTHRARSQLLNRGRRSPRARVRTPIWWRSARFSSASSRFVRSDDLAVPKMTRIKLHTPRTLPAQDAAAQLISCG